MPLYWLSLSVKKMIAAIMAALRRIIVSIDSVSSPFRLRAERVRSVTAR